MSLQKETNIHLPFLVCLLNCLGYRLSGVEYFDPSEIKNLSDGKRGTNVVITCGHSGQRCTLQLSQPKERCDCLKTDLSRNTSLEVFSKFGDIQTYLMKTASGSVPCLPVISAEMRIFCKAVINLLVQKMQTDFLKMASTMRQDFVLDCPTIEKSFLDATMSFGDSYDSNFTRHLLNSTMRSEELENSLRSNNSNSNRSKSEERETFKGTMVNSSTTKDNSLSTNEKQFSGRSKSTSNITEVNGTLLDVKNVTSNSVTKSSPDLSSPQNPTGTKQLQRNTTNISIKQPSSNVKSSSPSISSTSKNTNIQRSNTDLSMKKPSAVTQRSSPNLNYGSKTTTVTNGTTTSAKKSTISVATTRKSLPNSAGSNTPATKNNISKKPPSPMIRTTKTSTLRVNAISCVTTKSMTTVSTKISTAKNIQVKSVPKISITSVPSSKLKSSTPSTTGSKQGVIRK